MSPIEAATAAGWVFLGFDYWMTTDIHAFMALEHPLIWSGTARDLCLGHAIDVPGMVRGD